MNRDPDKSTDQPDVDPVRAAIVHAVLVAGFLAVHFGVVPLW